MQVVGRTTETSVEMRASVRKPAGSPSVIWRIPYFRHDLGEAELACVARVLEGDILTTGDLVSEFEARFATYLDIHHVLAVTSCTGALHMALLALGIGPGDEVITTPMSFVATATAILEAGATPVFVDVEADTGNLDAAQVEAAITPRTKAILPVHLYGLMCDMRALKAIADRHGLRLIEDAAHCIEGVRDGVRPGELSDAACFSFYATKNLTCGEGGAIAVNNHALAERLNLLRLHGMTRMAKESAREGYRHWDMVLMGWKYNMSNIEAALLLPQFERMEAKLARRHALAARYEQAFAGMDGIKVPCSRADSVHARHVFTVWCDGCARDDLMAHLHRERIGAVVNYRPIHLMSHFVGQYGYSQGDFPVAEWIGERTISLPLYPDMLLNDIDVVAEAVGSFLSHSRRQHGLAGRQVAHKDCHGGSDPVTDRPRRP
jgi:dTDP-4-amino-4,6-dideoxygalactose transaminase